MRTFSVTRREERKARECSLCLSRFLISYLLPFVGGVAFSQQEKRDREASQTQKKKEREKREFLCGSKKRDFSDDDDEVVYIFLSEKKMAQRSPRKSLQLNRANTPINFSGPMQDVNVSSASFFF